MSYLEEHTIQIMYGVAETWQRPSTIYRPVLSADGDKWCALMGEDLQIGVAGFGDTPSAAMEAFDRAFHSERTPAARRLAGSPL